MMFYVVIEIQTKIISYAGPNLRLAAERLNPGTCYGSAATAPRAYHQAYARAREFSQGV